MRDDHQSSEEQFQMSDPVWRLLNGIDAPWDEQSGQPSPRNPAKYPSIKAMFCLALIPMFALLFFRYFS